MTKEEAIKDIQDNILPVVGGKSLVMAISALQQPEIIHCRECKHHIDGRFCRMANHHTPEFDYCASVFGAERREE